MPPAAERIPPQTASQTDFDLKQHDALRLEIQTAEAAARANERYAIIALAALWAWTAKEAPNTGFVAAAISALIGILGATRMWALWINMKTKADYVAQLEYLLSRPALGGWEHYFAIRRLVHKPYRRENCNSKKNDIGMNGQARSDIQVPHFGCL